MTCKELRTQGAEIEMEGSLLEDLPGIVHEEIRECQQDSNGICYDTRLISMTLH